MKKKLLQLVVALIGVFTLFGAPPTFAALPPDFERTTITDALNSPTDFRELPDGRILIAEKGGAIKLVHDGHVHSDPLITLAVLQTDQNEERGLLGIEPDPNFAQNGYLYVSYTTAANYDRLSRITITGDTADPASEVVLMQSDQLGNIYHHGGEIHFGPDGKLYWAMGMNTYNPNSQNLSNLHGKILRLNTDGSAPEDNPYVHTPGAIPQIWAYGLRNPFRFTFTPNGKLIVGDVGGDQWEELNVITKGGNYGWPLAEGDCGSTCQYVNPIYSYHHTEPPEKAGSITSAMVYTGSTFGPAYQNKFFIADYTLHWIKALTFDSEYTSFIGEETFDDDAGTTVKLSQALDGNMYQMTIFPGALYKIAPTGGNHAPTARITATPTNGLAPLNVSFSSATSSDPENTPLTYSWDFGDGTTSTAANPTKIYTTNGTYTASLVVSDGEKTSTATQKITVGSTAPTADITTPINDSKYNAGDTINFSGTGSDAEDGTLPQSAYKWKVVFHHADHIHPFRDNITGTSGSVDITRDADNIDTTWYEIILTVTDSSGLSTSDSINIRPNLVQLSISANHPDAKFTVDGIPYTGSLNETAVVGVNRVVDGPSPQYVDDGQYIFNSWSDGLAKSHTITTPAVDSSYQINFDKFITPPAPWQSQDVGHPSTAGYSSYSNGAFTIRGAGGDIWGPTDEFHYVHQPFAGDGTIIARVTSQTDTDDWAKSGIMIKESTTAGSKYVLLAVTPANGITFQYNFNGDGGSVPYAFPNAWLKLTRVGNTFTAFASADGTNWTQVGQTTLAMAANATAGLEVMSHKFDQLNTSTFDNVSVTSNQEWMHQDIGAPAIAGNTVYSGSEHTVTGAGDDIWGTADQFHYDYQELEEDGELVARVKSFTGTTDGWAKAGVMIKQSTTAGSPYALLATTPVNGINFQHSFNSNSAGPTYALPNAWLKIKRTGNTITSFASNNGQTWQPVGSATIQLSGTVLIGMFVGSHNGSAAATAVFDNITLTRDTAQAEPLPAPWANGDVGAPTLSGATRYSNGEFTVTGAGDDIWGDADQFQFVHQTLTGDGEIVARVKSFADTTDGWAKAGVMIKQSTTAGSPYALLAATPGNGVTFQYNFSGNGGETPYTFPNAWLKLSRTGNTIKAYTSADGATWTLLNETTVTLTGNPEIGLFVSSHNGSVPATAVFDNVAVNATAPATPLPTPWTAADVGAPNLAGSTTYDDGTFTVTGAGDDIWGDADQFQFVHQTLTGDGQIIARVKSFENTTDDWAKAGIMVKQSMTTGSHYALLATTPANGVTFQYDFANDGGQTPYMFPNAWLKLVKTGNIITASTSADGTTWTQLGQATLTLSGSVEIGLFVSSHNGSARATSTFDNVAVSNL